MPQPIPPLTKDEIEDYTEAANIIQDWWINYRAHKKFNQLQEELLSKK